MNESEDVAELLFFDTFSHEVDTDINLDLVQFPKPVFITQVRIIPLGARVQADFPGGVRLGATNPSKFDIDFFVNDLGMPGASTFENFGHLQYNQNDCIHLECAQERIPTDGLVLRGWYSTITLAVYGILSNSMNNEQIASPQPPPCDTASSEELCNLSSSGEQRRNSALDEQEEQLKEAWKEPVEVTHGHKSNMSDFERDDVEFSTHNREHYHYSSDERERRLRTASHSSDRSGNSRNRTHSETERDYLRHSMSSKNYANHSFDNGRDKTSRDWSPEYGRRGGRRKYSEHSSRSDAEDKWPRTPPATIGTTVIDSPMRPISPDNLIDYVDVNDDDTPKYKSRKYAGRSNDALTDNMSETAHNRNQREQDDDDALSTPGITAEVFEPILSDDELLGDEDTQTANTNNIASSALNEYDMEFEAEAVALGPAIVYFDAYKMPLQKFANNLQVQFSKDLQNLQQLYNKYEKCYNCYKTFMLDLELSAEQRETFVYFGEQLVIQLTAISTSYKRRNYVLQSLFQLNEGQFLKQTCRVLQIGLDFEAACLQQQPACKIRHIKVGARLMELLGYNKQLLQYCLQENKFDPCAAIFALYNQGYMALSIKQILLRGVYSLLDTNYGVQHFLAGKVNGYQLVLTNLQQARLTPIKYALQAIIKKLHLYEALQSMRDTCNNLFAQNENTESNFKLLLDAMQLLLNALQANSLSYQQPKRFLPVTCKYEIVIDVAAQRSFYHSLQTYFKDNALAELLVLVFTHASQLPLNILQRGCDLLQTLLKLPFGVDYFVDDCFASVQLLVTVLLQSDNNEVPAAKFESKETKVAVDGDVKIEEDKEHNETSKVTETINEEPILLQEEQPNKETGVVAAVEREPAALLRRSPSDRFQRLGLELAYKVQTRYHLDAIAHFANLTQDHYLNANELATHLHILYSQTCNILARQYTVQLLGQSQNVQLFLDIIRREQCLQKKCQLSSPGAKYKSPVLSFAVDMLDCCVRYCEQLDYLVVHDERILHLAKNHDSFEPSVSAVLQEMYAYLKPLQVFNMLAYEDITPLVDIITRSLDYINTFPGELIMALRILRHLCLNAPKSAETQELKQQHVALQFYAVDGVQTLLQILERISGYFEQPGLHTPVLVCIQGLHCAQIILSTLQILRFLLTESIRCRDILFKDLTAIKPLMHTYHLLHYYPVRCQAAEEVRLAKHEIIQLLLAYTQPHEAQDEESLHKSLWTLMLRELFKHIAEPATFIPGLQVLAELLPLPLPLALPASIKLTESQANRLITQRKWWSAHLHPLSAQISQLIDSIAATSFPQLSDLLTRVCLQLADLAPNMSLLISKTLTDLMWAEWQQNNAMPTENLARLLKFFAKLTAYASLKCSALTILSGKLWDLFQAILATSNTAQIQLSGYKCQAYVHRTLESFLDSEISLISPQSSAAPLLNLASALPPKEFIPRIVEALVNNLLSVDVTHEVSALGVRNIVILTEHDITFYYLYQKLKLKSQEFQQWLEKILCLNETESYNSNIESLVLLLRSLTYIEENSNQDATLPARSLTISGCELAQLISSSTESALQLLERMRNIFEQHKEECNELLLQDVSKLCEQLQALPKSAEGTALVAAEAEEEASYPVLPQTESLVTQYATRPIFTQYERQIDDVQLTANYWLDRLSIDSTFGEDYESQFDGVVCDLTELAADCLTENINITAECKRVLHLSTSPQSNRERTPTAPCFRTQRVEVEPSTGRPEKKLYITPVRGRGFPRVPPSRGDLFRSRPPNTSRPPSLHVDDFLALETRGAQPTGPTGYNKIPAMLRGTRVGRNRGSRISAAAAFRKSKLLRTSSPSSWNENPTNHYRTSGTEVHFGGEQHYTTSPFSRARGRGMRARSYLR